MTQTPKTPRPAGNLLDAVMAITGDSERIAYARIVGFAEAAFTPEQRERCLAIMRDLTPSA